MITVLQAAEHYTDVQAAEAVRSRLDWKYCLGLALDDRGLDDSVLSEFRTRLVEHSLESKILDLSVARLVEAGLLKAGGKQRTDSTHVLAAVRQLNQVELVGETVRACLEALAAAEPGWVAAVLDASWQRRYTARVDAWRMPASKTKRVALGNDYARDGHALLRAVWHPGAPDRLRQVPAVGVLHRVLIQNTKVTTDRTGREVITLRDATLMGSRLADVGSGPRMTSTPAGAASGTWSGTATSCTSASPATQGHRPPRSTARTGCQRTHRT